MRLEELNWVISALIGIVQAKGWIITSQRRKYHLTVLFLKPLPLPQRCNRVF
jgi:hypothetical protein